MGSHSLLQGIFPTQRSNPGLQHCRQILYCLSHQWSFPDGLPLWASPMGFPDGLNNKESACNAGDLGSNPGSGRSPGKENGYPLQYSCLENSTNRGAWRAIVRGSQRVGHDWVINTSLYLCVCCLHTAVLEWHLPEDKVYLITLFQGPKRLLFHIICCMNKSTKSDWYSYNPTI